MQSESAHGLVQRAKAGDQESWGRLVAMFQPYLLQRAHSLPPAKGLDKSYQDLTQETWIRAWQGLPRFRGGEDDAQTAALFRAWLCRILKNVCSNVRRHEAASRRQPPPGTVHLGPEGQGRTIDAASDESTLSANLRAQECSDQVREALAGLADPKDREIVRLRFFEGLSLTRTAERLGLTLDEVRDRFHASLRALEPRLKDLQ
ncbi:MAG TPA: sigma-70 family RNA polymerase sigma factor [Gemmataceae bacterium]|nr:sigma-70 family RNA polymerase sigma factor [Gemmataceae bacterium]